MKKLVVVISVGCFVFSSYCARGALVVSDILVDQTWTAADSPYFICYPATILSNVTLTIEPGTVVILGKGEKVDDDHYLAETLKVEGTLIADGATFTSWTNPNPAAWAHLQFLNGSVGRLTNCTFEHGGSGPTTYGLIHANGTVDLEFVGCLFRYGEYLGDSGIHILSSATGTVRFTNCQFTNLNIGITTERDSGVDVFVNGCVFDNLHAYGCLLRNNFAEIRNSSFRNILSTDVVLWEQSVNAWWCKTASLIGNQFDGGGKGESPVLMYGAVNFSAASNTLSGYAVTNQGVVVGGWVPKGWSAVWSASDLPYIMRETVTVEGDASSLGSLTIQSGATIRQYPEAALRVWGSLTVTGTPTSRVLFTTALGTRTGNGLWINSGWGEINVAYCDFINLNRGFFLGWTYTPTVRVTFAQCLFSNIVDRAFDILDGIGHHILRVFDSALVECGTSLYTDRGGDMTFSNVLFRDTGPIQFANSGNNALFENCAMIGMRRSSTGHPITGPGAGVVFRHCTLVGSDGLGMAATAVALRDSIIWGHLEQAIGSASVTASYCCIEGGYTGPGSNNLMLAPGFIGWSGSATVFVDAASSCPGDGSATNPFCSLANAIAQYRAGYNYGLATNSPCIGAASDGGNIGASLGVGAAGAASVEIRLAPGTYGLGNQNLLMGISLIGASPDTVLITNTIKGLQTGARLEGVTVASAQNRGLEIWGPRSPSIGNCVFSNLTNIAIHIYNGYPNSVDPCAPTITAVRIRDMYLPAVSSMGGIYIDGQFTPWKTTPEIRNCLFHNIRSGTSGRQGALHAYYASPLVLNCTFYTNKIGLCSEGAGTVTVWNCISYQNSNADIWNYQSAFRIGHSDYGTYSVYTPASLWTTNNINADPLFVDRNAFDLRLQPASPCINRGTNQTWMIGVNDFFGNPRILHRFVDIGAYEHLFEWPMIGVSPTAMTVRAATTEPVPDQFFETWNAGAGILNYTIMSNAPWLSPAPSSGTSTGETDIITVGFQTAGLAAGNYTGLITIADATASNSPQNVPVILLLQAPAIRRDPTNISVSVAVGGSATARTFTVWNGTTGTMSYVLTTNVSWLTVTPSSGTSTGEQDVITVDFDSAPLPPGTYTGAVSIISAEATNSPQEVYVTLNVLGPYIFHIPTTLTALTAPGASPSAQVFHVRNGGPHTINYIITTNVGWLTVSPGGGSSTGEWDTITVTYDTASLPVGTHTGIITIASAEATNSPQTVTVRVHVLLPAIGCSPTGFAFAVTPGAAYPSRPLQISNATLGVMNYNITTNASWLAVVPVSGVSTGETDIVTLSFQTESLAEGPYTGYVTIASAQATNSPVNIPVFVKVLDFNRALNTTNLPWRSGGDAAWFLQTNTTHDGVEAAQSGPIGHSQTSWVEVALSGPARLSFWWRVSSENGYDFLRFYVDTTLVASISGTNGWWLSQTNIIPDGTHLLRWAYIKDISASAGSDCGWLDEVRYLYDSDGDGLPDIFEERYWGNPVSTNVWDGDFDGDGYSNGDEFLADSNPLSNASMPPRFTNVTAGVISQCDLSPTSTQRYYHVSATTNLSGSPSWIPVATNIRGNAGALQFWVTNDAPALFYRAVITRPP